MKDHRFEFSVEKMARVLDVSKSGYYAWKKRPVSTRKKNQIRFDADVKALLEESKQTCGSVRLTKGLVKKGKVRTEKEYLEACCVKT